MFDMLMRRAKKQKIITIGVSEVSSAAIWPFVCGHERQSYKHTLFMFHEPNISGGNLSRIRTLIKVQWRLIFEPCIRRCYQISNRKDMKFWTNLFSGREMYFTAKEMKKLGLVTKIS